MRAAGAIIALMSALLEGCSANARFDLRGAPQDEKGSDAPQRQSLGWNARRSPGGPGGATAIIVRPGETLPSIAEAHGVTIESLRTANALHSENITPGQQLIVPARP